MSLRYIFVIFCFLNIRVSSQEIQLIDIIYRDSLSYYHIYDKNTLSGDQYTEIHNLNVVSDKIPYLTSVYNCNNDYPSFYDINANNERIISFSMFFQNQIFDCNTYNKLKDLKEYVAHYSFEKKTKLVEENSKYKLLSKTINKGVFLVFSVSRNYFNGNDNQMWLYGKKKIKDVTVYRLLTEEDNEWIDSLIKQGVKPKCN